MLDKIKNNSFFKSIYNYCTLIATKLLEYIKRKLLLKDSLFDFAKIKFWNKFFVILYSIIIWLCLVSILGVGILERVLNPTKFASDNTVIIEIYPENTKSKTEEKTEVVTRYLNTLSYISSYRVIPEEELQDLVRSFSLDLGTTQVNMPVIILLTLNKVNNDILLDLHINLQQKVDNIYLDTEKDLLTRIAKPLSTVQIATVIIPVIAVLVLLSVIFITIYAILFSNYKTIEVLLFLGALKSYIYKEFGLWTLNKSLKGCLGGGILGIITSIVATLFLGVSLDIIPWMGYLLFLFLIILFLPILSSVIGMIFVNRILKQSFLKD